MKEFDIIEHGLFSTPNYIEQIMSDHLKKATKQQEDFIKSKIIEKGFGHLIEGIEKRVFPKIAVIKEKGWSYYYADNDTDEGAFIVAIQDYTFDTNPREDNFGVTMSCNFNWQDSTPLKRIV